MLSGIHQRVKKIGQSPGTPMYTGKTKTPPRITVIQYNEHDFCEVSGSSLSECIQTTIESAVTWVNVEGLSDPALIKQITEHYQIHSLTEEDILNVAQRPKVDEYEDYIYVSLKMLLWHKNRGNYSSKQLSIIWGNNFILTFCEQETTLFQTIKEKLRSGTTQQIRKNKSDYLAYRLMDGVVDEYFFILEGLGELIEKTEEHIIAKPFQQNSKVLYRLKRKIVILRKIIWPMREVISHLLQTDEQHVTAFTRLYLRDIYDHVVQAIDSVETFRDMLSSMLDMYLSSITNRMNEIMKVLTIISTIFIPITFISSVYGMNFANMPELHWRYGYFVTLGLMLLVVIIMLTFFRKKDWI